jgi:hypothetical protein
VEVDCAAGTCCRFCQNTPIEAIAVALNAGPRDFKCRPETRSRVLLGSFLSGRAAWHGSRGKPRNRAVADVGASGDFAHRLLVFVASLDRLLDLVRGEFRLATQPHAPRFGAFPVFASAGAGQVALELDRSLRINLTHSARRRRTAGNCGGTFERRLESTLSGYC